jgi:hypothetical protein
MSWRTMARVTERKWDSGDANILQLGSELALRSEHELTAQRAYSAVHVLSSTKLAVVHHQLL